MALSKQAIASHSGVFKLHEVHVPAWEDDQGDDVVLVRGMTIREFEINQARASEGLATALILARCIAEPDGARMFRDTDADMLAEMPFGDIQPISEKILEASGLGDKAGNDAVNDAIVDAEKNSGPTAGGETSSS